MVWYQKSKGNQPPGMGGICGIPGIGGIPIPYGGMPMNPPGIGGIGTLSSLTCLCDGSSETNNV